MCPLRHRESPGEHRLDAATHAGMSQRATTGVLWTTSQKWVIRITGVITVAILSRLLTPADFGVVAVALSLLPLVQLLADIGFSTYLVQAREPGPRTYATAFWYSAAAGLVLGLGLFALAPVLATLLGSAEVQPVIQALAPAALLVTLGSVPMARLQRGMRFRALAVQAVIAGFCGQAVAVSLAFAGAGVWALVAQTLTNQAIATSLAWFSAQWRPSWSFSPAELGAMFHFGVKVVGTEIVAMLRVWLENAIIVSTLGLTGLGYLNIAQRLIQVAQDLTTAALVPVSVVVFARVREQLERLRSGYLRAQTLALSLIVPMMLLIAIGAPLMLPFVFGDQWTPSVAPAQALGVAGVFAAGALDQGLFYGLGKPGTWLVYVVVVETITVLTTLSLARHGLLAIALGFLCVAAVAAVARWVMVARQLDTAWWRIATPLARVSVPGGLAALAGLAVRPFALTVPPAAGLCVLVGTIAAVYLPLSRWTMPDVWAELTSALARRTRTERP